MRPLARWDDWRAARFNFSSPCLSSCYFVSFAPSWWVEIGRRRPSQRLAGIDERAPHVGGGAGIVAQAFLGLPEMAAGAAEVAVFLLGPIRSFRCVLRGSPN